MTGRLAIALLLALAGTTSAAAQHRYAVVVAGASGGEPYATRLTQWRQTLALVLREKLSFDAERVLVFAEGADDVPAATRKEVTAAFDRIARVATSEDLVLVVLLGHGSYDGVEAKFNLVGPDLEAREWLEAIEPVRARIVFVNTTGASYPFLERLSAPRRIVVTATETPAQKFDTVFAEHFVAALGGGSADLDKDGRVSVLEAFSGASRAVKQHYERAGQLPIERAILDDNGDAVGKWAGDEGPDGAVAARTFLDGREAAAPADPVVAELLQRRAALEAHVDELRARKPLMPAEEYAREFERLMIDLARVSREIRRKRS